MLSVVLKGAFVSGSLIVAIGSQNAFLLKSGLKNNYVMLVATLCFLGDVLLISTGVLGVGALLQQAPVMTEILTLCGIAFLCWYGFLSAKSAWRGQSHLDIDNSEVSRNWVKVALMTLAMTFLNPHVYIDTILVLGGITSSLNFEEKRWFLVGALTASAIWFYGVAYIAKKLIPFFANPKTWQILDTVIAVIMFSIAAGLVKTLVPSS
ncbi:LysE/ArgO family amino acid transporter [Vibrio sp. CK2-1]|uniref:LysE/ArgO family amino acid transporter n=1 Tax=Vibrio sp. CK2-1 TaxID=2912249 RepID=UPI001F1F7C3A|nr:LysE/ArgO family amino acid transporter [Vibrio sp. CK2-1]MCF7353524.1 LysE/ArgO family amino acid transporter [Vibrio sp. CK2-1]